MINNAKFITGESISPVKLILRAVLAFLALLALRVRYETGISLEGGSFALDDLLASQFYFDGLTDLVTFAAIFLLLDHFGRTRKKAEWQITCLAIVFAVFYLIAKVCHLTGSFDFFFANSYQFFLSALILTGFSALFYSVLSVIFSLADKYRSEASKVLLHPWRNGAIIIFLCWLPWLLGNYPGSFCADSIWQISQYLGYSQWSAHHPPFSTALMGLCVSLGDLIWNRNFGVFLYILFQSISGAIIFSYILAVLYKMGISRNTWTILLIFFCTPFWAMFAQWFEKDFVYVQAFALCVCFLLPVIKERRCSLSDVLKIGSTALCAILLRKTGIYELLPALVLTAFWLKKIDRRRLISTALAVFILSSCVNNLLYPALGIEKGSVAEMLSIPFLQTARYVNEYPDEVTPEEREAIDAVLVYDRLGNYIPHVSDSIKGDYRENAAALPEYFSVWLQMFFKHPICYFEAAFMLSYGYFAPVSPSLDAYVLLNYSSYLQDMGFYRVFEYFPSKALDSLRLIFLGLPIASTLCMAGLYTWLLMLCFVQILRKKNYPSLLLFVPGIMNILICIASPVCDSTRYELPVIATIPIFIGCALLVSKSKY